MPDMTLTVAEQGLEKGLWKHAILWLMFLGPFFFLSYGFANSLAASQTDIGSIVYDWEQSIPFIPWTIVPYWSIDLLYGLSLFIRTSKVELNNHAKRLLTAQVVAVTCFILFPLGFSFERPEASGLFGGMFTALYEFDQPYNQAPSLHIALLVILWALFAKHVPGWLRWPLHIWCTLIAISVLTTFQHHFIDIPTGAALGLLCLWLWPDSEHRVFKMKSLPHVQRRLRLAMFYFCGSAVLFVTGLIWGGLGLWLLWPALSLLLVSIFYTLLGSDGFQKSPDGKMNLAIKWLLYPYLLGARINSRLWTKKDESADHIHDDVWLGRFPSTQVIKDNNFRTIVDLTAEFFAPRIEDKTGLKWHSLPSLDLITPSETTLAHAAALIEESRGKGALLVSCALGYSRSALAVIAWLLITDRAKDIDSAVEMVKAKRPKIVLNDEDRQVLLNLKS